MQDEKAVPKEMSALKVAPTKDQNLPVVTMGFGSLQSFELMQRAAKMLAYSTLVPVAYRHQKEIKDYGKVIGYEDNPSSVPNCVVALNMAQRMGADPLMIMQNLYIVEGRPSWSSQFIIAAINSCGRYSPLRFDMSVGGEPREIEYTEIKWEKNPNGGKDQKKEVPKKIKIIPRTCIAWAIELATGDRLESPAVTMDMAVAEGWLQKNGSKWQTMPDVMLRYRSAAFFGKIYAPELLMGLQTAEEAHDIIDVEQQPNGQYAAAQTTLDEMRSGAGDTARPEGGKVRSEPRAETVAVHENQPEGQSTIEKQRKKAEEVRAEYGDKEAENFEPNEPLKPASTGTKGPKTEAELDAARLPGEISEDANTAQRLVMRELLSATTSDALAEAADLIKTVPNAVLRDELATLYRERFAALQGDPEPQAAAASPAAGPTKRARRTASAPE